MKTVKDYIGMLDVDQLADMYFSKYDKSLYRYYKGSPLSDEKDDRIPVMTISEFVEDQKRLFYEYVEHLKSIDITPDENGKQGIIYAYNKLEGYYYWSDTLCTELIYLNELKEDPENCENYGYMLTDFSETLGFLVADNQYTQGNIYEVIADVLYEASWFGYRKEEIEEERKVLEEQNEELEKSEGNTYESVDALFTELLGEEGFKEMKDRSYHETEEGKELGDAAREARYKYEHYSMVKERKLILEALKDANEIE